MNFRLLFFSRWSSLWANEPLLIADRYESLFGLLIQFNAFLVCSLFIPAQYHLSYSLGWALLLIYLTVPECHKRWWIRINMELSSSRRMMNRTAHTFPTRSSGSSDSCRWINHESQSKANYAAFRDCLPYLKCNWLSTRGNKGKYRR